MYSLNNNIIYTKIKQFFDSSFNRKYTKEDKILHFHKKRIPITEYNRIKKKYINVAPYPGYSKYLELKKWLKKSIYFAKILDLDKSKRLRILDLGTGAGYFPFVCNNYGHITVAVDLEINEMYNELTELLKIDRHIWEIKAFGRLPDFGISFNLITAFSICFNNHAKHNLWKKAEWRFFINDLYQNHLEKNGIIFLELNQEPHGLYYDNDLLEFFIAHGAVVNKNEICLNYSNLEKNPISQ